MQMYSNEYPRKKSYDETDSVGMNVWEQDESYKPEQVHVPAVSDAPT
jgi:hypothetical protein